MEGFVEDGRYNIHFLYCSILSVYFWIAVALTYSSEIRSIGVVGLWLDLAVQLGCLVFGELANYFSWVEILGRQLGRFHWIFSLPIFLGLRTLAGGKNGHCVRFWEGSQPLRQVGICDIEEWKDFRGSIYFRDGAVTQHGDTMPAVSINITACFAIARGNQHCRKAATLWCDPFSNVMMTVPTAAYHCPVSSRVLARGRSLRTPAAFPSRLKAPTV